MQKNRNPSMQMILIYITKNRLGIIPSLPKSQLRRSEAQLPNKVVRFPVSCGVNKTLLTCSQINILDQFLVILYASIKICNNQRCLKRIKQITRSHVGFGIIISELSEVPYSTNNKLVEYFFCECSVLKWIQLSASKQHQRGHFPPANWKQYIA